MNLVSHQALPTSLSPYLLQGMTGMPHLLPSTIPAQRLAALPYIIQSYWLPHSVLSTLYSLDFPLPLLLMWASLGSCSRWTLPDVPARGYTFPFMHKKPSPPPYPGAVLAFFFYVIFSIHIPQLQWGSQRAGSLQEAGIVFSHHVSPRD